MFFAPYIVRCSDSSSVQVKIDTALAADISATHNAPLWQTNLANVCQELFSGSCTEKKAY